MNNTQSISKGQKDRKANFMWYIIIGLIGIGGGIMIGMLIQQAITQTTIVRGMEAFSGTINIDLNETEMVDRLFEILNETGELEK